MKFSLISACLFGLVAAQASAATLKATTFSTSAYAQATSAGVIASENFETFGEGNVANGFATSVGRFSTIGGTGSGGTVKKAGFDNDGTLLALRDGNVYGRHSTTRDLTGNGADDMFLDSNDTHGIRWDASAGGAMFNKIVLTISDMAEFGATLEILAGSQVFEINNQPNGMHMLVTIRLDEKVSASSIFFTHKNRSGNVVNDGFSLDDLALSEVPLPASALLLLVGLGGLGACARRKKD